MSGCESYFEQVGPYVLRALEPDEMDAMRGHLAACERCAAEERSLAGLPALLDHAQAESALAGAPPETPRPELEDAVLDRFVRDRTAGDGDTPAAPAPAGTRPLPARLHRRGWRPLAAAVAAAVALAVALVVLWPGDDDRAYARAELSGNGAHARAWVAAIDEGTRVRLEADRLRRGTYELWCVRTDGRWVSGGSFHSRADGTAAADLTAAVHPGDYHVVAITRRSTGGERGAEVMRGELQY